MNKYRSCQLYQTYSLTTPTGAINRAVVGLSRAHLSSLVSMPLLIKAMMPEQTLVVISRVAAPVVQTLKSMRTGHTSCSSFSRRVGLGIGLATLSQVPIVLNSVRTTTFLTFSTLSITSICWMFQVPTIATLDNLRVHSSPSYYSSIPSKVK